MPFKSKAQSMKFRVMEARGEIPKGTSHRWAKHTPGGVKSLPDKKRTKKAMLCALVSGLQKRAELHKIMDHLNKKAEGAAAPQATYPGPMQPMQAGQASGAAMTPHKADDIAKNISQFGDTHRGRAAYERLAQYRRGAVKGYAAASQPDAKKRFQTALGKSGSDTRLGTPFMDGFIRCCVEQDLSGEQVADILEKAAKSEGKLGEEARGMIDRMLKL
jgi:hypothetical protein